MKTIEFCFVDRGEIDDLRTAHIMQLASRKNNGRFTC